MCPFLGGGRRKDPQNTTRYEKYVGNWIMLDLSTHIITCDVSISAHTEILGHLGGRGGRDEGRENADGK